MYALLSSFSQDAISQEDFIDRHVEIESQLMLQSIQFQILSALAEGNHAQAAYAVEFQTVLLDPFSMETVMNLTLEQGSWRVQWEVGMILPELRGGNILELNYKIPARGRIYASDGSPLAAYENAVALGLVPGEILPGQADLLYATLAALSPYTPESLAQKVADTPDDWYLPVASLSQEKVMPYLETLTSLSGVRIDEFRSRYYVEGGIASHALGYLLLISEADWPMYQDLGYRQDERVGASGLEEAYQSELAGQRGGTLYLKSPEGAILGLLALTPSEPAQSLYTTLDKTLQTQIQASLGDLRAAVVVMEVETGRILALVSNPTFDPNAFDLTHMDPRLLEAYFSDENRPLLNRATQGQYPLGSVFKIITMAAALETGLYDAGDTFICGQSLWVCDSVTLYDWTYSHGAAASGELNLLEGLMRSCNPWFYRIGERLYGAGMETALSEMAVGFGLGAPTEVDINEAPGNIPETAGTCVNSAQMAIGQGEILVTPLQVVRFIAALANGGKLYRPALVEEIRPDSGPASYTFSPEYEGQLPVSDATLASIQEALRMVVDSPRGTAYWALDGLGVPVSGKTGTAQTPSGNAHAWFAGYSTQNDPERPDIAVVVLVENGGEGSAVAAPVFRRVMALYFSDYEDPGGTLPWETAPFTIQTPTPAPTATSPSEE
jgi:penicillin-binding protein 2